MRTTVTSQMTVFTEKIGPNSTAVPMMAPPDGGWGWIIVFIAFLTVAILDGISYSFFLFREPMDHDISIDSADIALLSALFTGFYFVGGIIGCSVGNYFGFKIVMILGASVSCLSFASGYVLQDIFYFLLIIGLIGGFAGGFISVAGFLPVGFYFDRKRSIAMGFAVCGSGVGGMVMPHIINVFMDQFGWRLTYLFEAGLFGCMIVLGLFILPLKPVAVIMAPSSWTSLPKRASSSVLDYSIYRIPTKDTLSTGRSSVMPSALMYDVAQPTISEMAQELDIISIKVRDTNEQSILLRLSELKESRILQSSASVLQRSISIEQEELLQLRKLPWYKCGCCRDHQSLLPGRPLLRTDILYTGSLNRLDEYTTKEKDLEYHMQVTRVPHYIELTRSCTRQCCQHILHGIRILIDYTLLKSPMFICLSLCALATYLAFYLPYIYAEIHLEDIGKAEYAPMMVSMIGLGCTIGRIFSGIIVTAIPRFGARTTTSLMSFIAGVAIIASAFTNNLNYKFGAVILHGATIGFFSPLRSIIIVDFMGLNCLTSATGMLVLFQGCGAFLGAPIAEAILEETGNKSSPLYLCGGVLIFASITLWPLRTLQKWEKRRKEKKILTTPHTE